MTVAVPGQGGVIDTTGLIDEDDLAGLEDLDESDVRLPRLKIVGPDKVFKDTLTGVSYPRINTIILGVIKQRLMWAEEVDEDDQPLCKSPDHEHGFPNVNPEVPTHKRFPWHLSSFNDPAWQVPNPDPAMNGHVVLPCVSCNFKDWGQDAQNKRKPPPCAEQFSYVVVYGAEDEEPSMPAVLTIQRSGMQAAKAYNAYYVTQRKPFFVNYTIWDLDQKKRGSVIYCTPILQRGEATDSGMWSAWADQYRSARDFLRRPPRALDDGSEQVGAGNANTPPQAAPAPPAPPVQNTPPQQAAPPQPAAAPEPPSAPAPVPTPAPEPVAQQVAPPVQTAPEQAPIQAPETPAPQAVPQTPVPPRPATPPQPAAAPAPAAAPPQPAAPADSADDLPF